MAYLYQLFDELLQNKLSPAKVSLIARGIFAFAILVALLAILTSPFMSQSEFIFYDAVKKFDAQADFSINRLNLYTFKVYIFSLPFKIAGPLGQSSQLLIMRLFSLPFLVLTLWLAYQTAKRTFVKNDFISLSVLVLLATNNKLLSSATMIGGDLFIFFFFAFFVYELVEIATKGSLVDIIISLVLVFLLAQVDSRMAEKIAMPVMFFVLALTILVTFKDQLKRRLPKSGVGLLAAGAAIVAAFIYAQRVSSLAPLVYVPTAVLIGVFNIFRWSVVFNQLVNYFAAVPDLKGQFILLEKVFVPAFQILALIGFAGMVRLLFVSVNQHVQVVKKEATPDTEDTAANGGVSGFQLALAKPNESVFSAINTPAFATVASIPLTALAAFNAYTVSTILNDLNVIILTVPLTLLLGTGIGQIISFKPLKIGAGAIFIAFLTLNTTAALLAVLWR